LPLAGNARDDRVLPLWDHVTELTKLLRLWIYTFITATMVFMVLPADLSFLNDPFAFYKPFVSVILLGIRDRLLPSSVQLISGSFTAPIEIYFLSSIVLGFAVSVPVLAYEIYRFVDPALLPHERQAVLPFVSGFSLLFLAGMLFGLFILLPFVVYGTLLFLPITGAAPFVNIGDFYSLVFFTVLATGFLFTFPVFLVLLVKFGITGTNILRRNRKYLYVGLLILTFLITPDGSLFSNVALFVPIIVLLEASVLVARRYEKHRPPGRRGAASQTLRCAFCDGPIDAGGVFCGRCGKSKV